jgi:sporulation protein YlmC with PRC-barrel domain
MRNEAQLSPTSGLSYLEASKVISPAGALSELDVLSADGRRLGSIEGVVIDAAARHVRYLAVRLSSWFGRRRCLVQADHLGQIESERKALRLRMDLWNDTVHDLDTKALRKFSDDDLLAAVFAPRAA